MTIMANDLKTRGVKILDEVLKKEEAIISVRGKSK
jgi:antitoxin (DNA-binding transcriptional repressor) of toxin-antitoxin stability system